VYIQDVLYVWSFNGYSQACDMTICLYCDISKYIQPLQCMPLYNNGRDSILEIVQRICRHSEL